MGRCDNERGNNQQAAEMLQDVPNCLGVTHQVGKVEFGAKLKRGSEAARPAPTSRLPARSCWSSARRCWQLRAVRWMQTLIWGCLERRSARFGQVCGCVPMDRQTDRALQVQSFPRQRASALPPPTMRAEKRWL